MKKFRAVIALLICASLLLLSSCKNIGGFSGDSKELKIGVSAIEGMLNPFYASNKADAEIISQMFSPIQRTSNNNSLINHAGDISYEFTEDNKVKYIVGKTKLIHCSVSVKQAISVRYELHQPLQERRIHYNKRT